MYTDKMTKLFYSRLPDSTIDSQHGEIPWKEYLKLEMERISNDPNDRDVALYVEESGAMTLMVNRFVFRGDKCPCQFCRIAQVF